MLQFISLCPVLWSCAASKVLIPTYLKAPPEEYTPYLQQALRPCLPIVLPGVTAKTWEGEFKRAEHALMQRWKAGRGRKRGWAIFREKGSGAVVGSTRG